MSKLLLICLLFLPACCKAENNCRWLNEATAAGVLDGPVSLDVQNMGDMEGSCSFHLKSEPGANGLQITVHAIGENEKGMMSYGSRCISPAIPLRAIGNEAALCPVKIGRSPGEQVIGRVRDKVFVVRIDATMRDNRSGNNKLLQQKAVLVAEQVAGSLF